MRWKRDQLALVHGIECQTIAPAGIFWGGGGSRSRAACKNRAGEPQEEFEKCQKTVKILDDLVKQFRILIILMKIMPFL